MMEKNGINKGKQKILTDIEKFGWHIINVMEGKNYPGFAYSIGLFKSYKHPEIIIIGLKPELAQVLINNIGYDIKNGSIYNSDKFYSNILDNYDCKMIEVLKGNYKEYVGLGIWYYENDNFPLLQCIYPTLNGIYPWDKTWPKEIIEYQPILGKIKTI